MKVLRQLIYIEPNEREGFNFGYFIKISNNGTNDKIHLIGECNNCGIVDSNDDAYKKTLWNIEYNGLVCKRLQSKLENSAIVIPCFTRPMSRDGQNDIYTHMLTSQAIKTDIALIKRVDRQFASMIKNAKKVLSDLGFVVAEKVIMTGFSASAKFAQRFALLYPETVSCVVAGGMGAVPCLPIKEYNGETLNYPLGVNDYREITGKSFDAVAYRSIKHYLFMGDLDDNDIVKYDDCVTGEERRIIYKLYGNDNQTRWINMVETINKLDLDNCHAYLIKGVAHSPQGMDQIIDAHLDEIKNAE